MARINLFMSYALKVLQTPFTKSTRCLLFHCLLYNFHSASDNRSSETGESTATVTVSIEDLNDKTPEFPKSPTYVSYIDEDAKEGMYVISF